MASVVPDDRVLVPGLARPLRLLHATDLHICELDADDPLAPACQRRQAQVPSWVGKPNIARLHRILGRAKAARCDAVALTGDIIDFPSRASIAIVRSAIAKAGIPVCYVPGNHDASYPPWPSDLLERKRAPGRERLRPRLEPLSAPQPPGPCQRWEVGGLQILGLDDSLYRITRAQLAFLRRHLVRGRPTVLLLHIPINVPELREPTRAVWRDTILLGEVLAEDARRRWGAQPVSATTREAIRLIQRSRDLHAICAGHVHFPHRAPCGLRATQFVGAGAFTGASRLIEFAPT